MLVRSQVDFCTKMFETAVPVKAVFTEGEMIDVIGKWWTSVSLEGLASEAWCLLRTLAWVPLFFNESPRVRFSSFAPPPPFPARSVLGTYVSQSCSFCVFAKQV